MKLQIRPNPDSGVRAAIQRALEEGNGASVGPSAYRSRWRRAGLDYAAGRPRKRRGATRA